MEFEFLSRCLAYDPTHRASSDDLLCLAYFTEMNAERTSAEGLVLGMWRRVVHMVLVSRVVYALSHHMSAESIKENNAAVAAEARAVRTDTQRIQLEGGALLLCMRCRIVFTECAVMRRSREPTPHHSSAALVSQVTRGESGCVCQRHGQGFVLMRRLVSGATVTHTECLESVPHILYGMRRVHVICPPRNQCADCFCRRRYMGRLMRIMSFSCLCRLCLAITCVNNCRDSRSMLVESLLRLAGAGVSMLSIRTAYFAVALTDAFFVTLASHKTTRLGSMFNYSESASVVGACCMHIASKCEDVSYVGIRDVALFLNIE